MSFKGHRGENARVRKTTEHLLCLPACKVSLQKNAHYMAVKVYNHLPDSIKELQVNLFKIKIHKWLVDKCFYSMNDFFNDKIK